MDRKNISSTLEDTQVRHLALEDHALQCWESIYCGGVESLNLRITIWTHTCRWNSCAAALSAANFMGEMPALPSGLVQMLPPCTETWPPSAATSGAAARALARRPSTFLRTASTACALRGTANPARVARSLAAAAGSIPSLPFAGFGACRA